MSAYPFLARWVYAGGDNVDETVTVIDSNGDYFAVIRPTGRLAFADHHELTVTDVRLLPGPVNFPDEVPEHEHEWGSAAPQLNAAGNRVVAVVRTCLVTGCDRVMSTPTGKPGPA